MGIPFDQQYFVEKQLNNKYEWLVFVITLILLVLHGLLFHWIPLYLRNKRNPSTLSNVKYFKFLHKWDMMTSCCKLRLFNRWDFYYQPSLVLFCLVFTGMCVGFCFAEVTLINYQGYMYPISKRIGRVGVGNLPILLWSVARNDWLTRISGFQFDRLEFLHKWLSRLMWLFISVHLSLGTYYWLSMNFKIMIMIPPQIFGFMAYGSLAILTWTSTKFIRRWAYDFWLVQHRVFAFIMLFMAFIHNPGDRAAVLIAVHGLVIDRVVSKIISHIHKYHSPTKCRLTFEVLDEDTILMTIPVKDLDYVPNRWFNKFFGYKNWKAGQHIFINVGKIKWFQYHPFTISSLSSSNEMKLLIRVQKGFTKNLYKYLTDIDHSEHDDETVTIQSMFAGPYGAVHQPFISFDSCIFFGAGSGGAFTFPVCLDLMRQIEEKDNAKDYLFRPRNPHIRFIWTIKRKRNIIWFKWILDELIPYVLQGKLTIDIYVTQENGSDDDAHAYAIDSSDESSCEGDSRKNLLKKAQFTVVENSQTLTGTNTNVTNTTFDEIEQVTEVEQQDPELKKEQPPQQQQQQKKSATDGKSEQVSTRISTINRTSSSMTIDPNSTFSTNTTTSSTSSTTPYNLYYGRPHIDHIIKQDAMNLVADDPKNIHKSISVASCGPPAFTNMIKHECQTVRKMKNSPDVYCYTESF